MDKLPGALWPQALMVRLVGPHDWALILPQIVEGVAAVQVGYRAVRRLAGTWAGLVAAAVLVLMPAVVALDRGNVCDSLMILLPLLAVDSVCAAVMGGGEWRLAMAGVWVGLGFQAKMTEAWLAVPALGAAYLVAGRGPWRASVRVGGGRRADHGGGVDGVDGGRLPGTRRWASLRRRQQA